jgi:DNA-binding Lrp family transcriptional regulator
LGNTTLGKARTKAYLMIQVNPLRVHQVLEEVRSLKGVTEARESTGSFDIVALIDAGGTSDLPSLLLRTTFAVPRVCAAAAVLTEPSSWREEGSIRNG